MALWIAWLSAGIAAALLIPAPGRLQPARAAARNRVVTLACVVAFLSGSAAAEPEAAARARLQYTCVILLGYGHLLGAAVFSARRLRALAPEGIPTLAWAAWIAVGVLLLYAVYAPLTAMGLAGVGPLLAVATWHTAENDLALARAYRRGLRLGAPARTVRARFVAALVTAGVVALSMATLPAAAGIAALPFAGSLSARVAFSDVFAASTLYHLASWSLFQVDRVRCLRETDGSGAATPVVLRLLAVHLAPAFAGAAVLMAEAPLAHVLFSPTFYLFASCLHVLQTSLVRRLPRSRPPR